MHRVRIDLRQRRQIARLFLRVDLHGDALARQAVAHPDALEVARKDDRLRKNHSRVPPGNRSGGGTGRIVLKGGAAFVLFGPPQPRVVRHRCPPRRGIGRQGEQETVKSGCFAGGNERNTANSAANPGAETQFTPRLCRLSFSHPEAEDRHRTGRHTSKRRTRRTNLQPRKGHRTMKAAEPLQALLQVDEDGAVTVDWVVLTAAIVGLGLIDHGRHPPGGIETGLGDLRSRPKSDRSCSIDFVRITAGFGPERGRNLGPRRHDAAFLLHFKAARSCRTAASVPERTKNIVPTEAKFRRNPTCINLRG
jgi:hypothetical protein